jgi:hypothetical protein
MIESSYLEPLWTPTHKLKLSTYMDNIHIQNNQIVSINNEGNNEGNNERNNKNIREINSNYNYNENNENIRENNSNYNYNYNENNENIRENNSNYNYNYNENNENIRENNSNYNENNKKMKENNSNSSNNNNNNNNNNNKMRENNNIYIECPHEFEKKMQNDISHNINEYICPYTIFYKNRNKKEYQKIIDGGAKEDSLKKNIFIYLAGICNKYDIYMENNMDYNNLEEIKLKFKKSKENNVIQEIKKISKSVYEYSYYNIFLYLCYKFYLYYIKIKELSINISKYDSELMFIEYISMKDNDSMLKIINAIKGITCRDISTRIFIRNKYNYLSGDLISL